MNLASLSIVGLSLAWLAPSGCNRAELAGPPEIRVGHDVCAECGMIINEDRCSSAFIVEREGTREYALFDDIGCMLDYQSDHAAEARFVAGFVHDYGTRKWGSDEAAKFLTADRERLKTPMGTGIVAFAEAAAAEKARGEFGGEVMDHSAVAKSRKAWKEAMYGKPRENP